MMMMKTTVDFSTLMAIEATASMEGEDFRGCDCEEGVFLAESSRNKGGVRVRHWKETPHAYIVRHEVKRVTVTLKQLGQGILAVQNKIKEDREHAKRGLEVRRQIQEIPSRMDGLGAMRNKD